MAAAMSNASINTTISLSNTTMKMNTYTTTPVPPLYLVPPNDEQSLPNLRSFAPLPPQATKILP
jgi:hypothetical protein